MCGLKSALPLAVVAVVSLLLGGCFLAPGNHMDDWDLRDGKAQQDLSVQLLPITPALIMQQEKERPPVTVPRELVSYQPGSYQIGPSDVLYVTVTASVCSRRMWCTLGRLISRAGTV